MLARNCHIGCLLLLVAALGVAGCQGKVEGQVDAQSQLEGMVIIGPGTQVVNSRIRGPVIIGADARIANAEIGPYTSLGDRVEVNAAKLENCVIMEDTAVRNVDQPLRDSLVGRKVRINGRSGDRGTRLLLGDYCETEIS